MSPQEVPSTPDRSAADVVKETANLALESRKLAKLRRFVNGMIGKDPEKVMDQLFGSANPEPKRPMSPEQEAQSVAAAKKRRQENVDQYSFSIRQLCSPAMSRKMGLEIMQSSELADLRKKITNISAREMMTLGFSVEDEKDES